MADAEDAIKSLNAIQMFATRPLFKSAGFSTQTRREAWLYTAASETFLKNSNTTIDGVAQSVPTWLKLLQWIEAYGSDLDGFWL
jgi:hypothetical protein